VSLGPAEILVILVIALLVFGPNRLPEVGRQVGRAVREFRQFQQTMKRDFDEVFHHDDVTDVSHAAAPPPTLPPKTDDATTPSNGAAKGELPAGDGEHPEHDGPDA
jgi:sec-independent protein translocase protein TatA